MNKEEINKIEKKINLLNEYANYLEEKHNEAYKIDCLYADDLIPKNYEIEYKIKDYEYLKEVLEKLEEENIDGFNLDGKHYSLYEGEQLQRSLERRIREQKDIQILAKASGNKELVKESQDKITQLTNKYKESSDVSGLPTKMERMRVNGYKRTSVEKMK